MLQLPAGREASLPERIQVSEFVFHSIAPFVSIECNGGSSPGKGPIAGAARIPSLLPKIGAQVFQSGIADDNRHGLPPALALQQFQGRGHVGP